MINKIIDFSVRNKLLIVLLTLALTIWGIYNFTKLPLDAVPDITNNQVQVITSSPALAPQEVEQFITFPVEIAMSNIQDVTEIRSISRFGLSVVTIVFKDKTDPYLARQMVSEQIKVAEAEIPEHYGKPEMMPVTTGLGEIYQYVLKPLPGFEGKYSPMELRTIQDWIVKRQLSGIPGIVEISSFGGYIKQYEISVSPRTLVGMDVSLTEIFNAVMANNENTGGSYIEKGPNTYYIRAEGLITDIEDIKKIVVKNVEGYPLLLGDIAEIRPGYPPRFGAMTRNGEGEAVGGITLMLKGANSSETIKNVKERVEEVKNSLPEGLEIHPYLDRSDLIAKTINTVSNNLLEGGLIVIFILILVLGSYRSGLIVASVIPLSMLFAFSMMRIFGVTANLMSLGAIDFGLIVDGSVIVVEGIVYQLQNRLKLNKLSRSEMDSTVYKASSRVAGSATFGVIIILIVYLPILAFTGIEGKMFRPMAQTVSFALLGALILSLTYVPVVASLMLKRDVAKKNKKNISGRIVRFFENGHRPVLEFALKYKAAVLTSTLIVVIVSFFAFTRMGAEFIPTLEEGDLAVQMTLSPGSSLSESIASSTRVEKILLEQFPEVKEVVSKIGTAEVPTDPMAVEDADIMVILKPKNEWVSASSREELADKMKEALSVLPGLGFEFQQPIQLRFNELMTGVKSDVAVKIYGEDLDVLYELANDAAKIISTVEGAGDVKVEQIVGLPQLVVRYKRDMLARYGMNVSDVNSVIRTAFAGQSAGLIVEGERRFDMVVRLSPEYRRDINSLKRLRVNEPDNELILLEQVADISIEKGPMQISRDDTRRRATIGINIRNRDVESFIEEVEEKLAMEMRFPPAYSLTFGGQFENLQAARQSSAIAVPLALALIFILLYFAFRSLKQAAMIFTAIPLAAVGGIWALYLRGMPFSISAGVGFIALFGIAVLNGIVLISYYNDLQKQGVTDILERVRTGTRLRLRPVILTASTDALGFLPMAVSTAAGAEVQKPLATVVIGGLITASFLTLIILPLIYLMFNDGAKKFQWKMKMPKIPVLIALLFLPAVLMSQKSDSLYLDMNTAVELALKNHPEINNARLEINAAEKLQKAAIELQALEVQYQHGQINSKLIDYQWSVSQNLKSPLYFKAQKALLAQNTSLSEKKLNILKADIIAEVRHVWNKWLFLKDKKEEYLALDSLLNEMALKAEMRYKTGDADKLSFLLAQNYAEKNSHDILTIDAEINYLQNQLKFLLLEDRVIFSREKELSLMDYSSPTIIEMADNVNIAYQKTMLEKDNAAIKAMKTSSLPELSIGYFRQSIDKENGFDGWQAGLSLPLWLWSDRAKIQASKIQALRTENRLMQLKQKEMMKSEKLINEFENALQRYKWYNDTALSRAEIIENNAGIGFSKGQISYFEFAKILEEAYQIKVNALEACFDLNEVIIDLHRISNR